MSRADFEGILEAMDGLPVTVRLLDPPLHEFLPHIASTEALVGPHSGSGSAGATAGGAGGQVVDAAFAELMGLPLEEVVATVKSLKETNPMLGALLI